MRGRATYERLSRKITLFDLSSNCKGARREIPAAPSARVIEWLKTEVGMVRVHVGLYW